MKLIIHAPNVHSGGGRALLLALLRAFPQDISGIAILDERLKLEEISTRVVCHSIKPTIAGRLAGEMLLKKLAGPDDIALCFGNLPPMFRLQAHTRLFLQNRYLSGNASLKSLDWKLQLRITLERIWLRITLSNANVIIVQSPSMQREVRQSFRREAVVKPFLPELSTGAPRNLHPPIGAPTFLYVASGEPHKNHLNLLKAWQLISTEPDCPELLLTLDAKVFESLELKLATTKGLAMRNVRNLGVLDRDALDQCYHCADALIYPSKMESFGLPLLEAHSAGLAIIAAEKDYVRDILDPDETFDPESPISIVRAVKRFLNKAEKRTNIESPSSFLQWLTT